MYHTVEPQIDCFSTWREAVRVVDSAAGHETHNVLMSVKNPNQGSQLSDPRVALVNEFLLNHDKSVRTVANTIFPEALYRRYGAPEFFSRFHKQVLPSVRTKENWSGYYFERMTDWPNAPQENPLWDIVIRLKDPKVRAKNKFELALFDPARDLNRSPYGGQCLSFLSFKVITGAEDKLALTAFYRNHYYVEKLLGNLIGLGQLMSFITQETGLAMGPLTVLSSHATIDLPKTCAGGTTKRSQIVELLKQVDEIA